ncbi:hypothetical protein [Serratia nevei]|uniref:hypothetical protein n=1 Tax=Serratia nevei TaxID=2703794 RepID=UPI0018D90862|nr:hypothetical protein [Serratia marcescens]MBI6128958.1 hypothetical protein [Serratia marcescens]
MNHIQFIEKHIKQKLIEAGYSAAIAQGGANEGVDLYKRSSQASAKGRMFDDCYRYARLWAEKNSTAIDKPIKKKQSRTAPTARPGLF